MLFHRRVIMFGILIKVLLIYLLVVFFRTLYQGYKTMNQLKNSMENQQDTHDPRAGRSRGQEGVVEAEYRVLDEKEV